MKRFSIGACVLALVLALGGCGKTEEPAGPGGAQGPAQAAASAEKKTKIAYLIKQPDEPWFQTEWKFAQKAADEHGFELVKIGATDGEKVMAALDNIAAQGVQGFVICTPDPRLGPGIVARAKAKGMKFMTVDDQFMGADNQLMADVHHYGMSAADIGRSVGKLLVAEFQKRGWKMEETGVINSCYEELDTARQRTDGEAEVLLAAGFPPDRIFKAPNKTTDVPGSFDAANVCLTKHADIKNWIILGMNDTAVLGAVRATEGRGIAPENVIGIGINGTDAISELQKSKPTGFLGSMLLSPNLHGYDTTLLVYKWVKEGTEPPLLTLVKEGTLITRDNYKQVYKDKGLTL